MSREAAVDLVARSMRYGNALPSEGFLMCISAASVNCAALEHTATQQAQPAAGLRRLVHVLGELGGGG